MKMQEQEMRSASAQAEKMKMCRPRGERWRKENRIIAETRK
jgi:hypothetical protein